MAKPCKAPRTGLVLKLVGAIYLALLGWKVEGEVPVDIGRAVLIAHPHTSNWDLPHMLAMAYRLRMKISWLGKHTLFPSLLGTFFRRLGGVSVDRRKPGGIVAQAAASINAEDGMWLAVPPSGTRKSSEYWKGGFYHIARTAKVPIVMCYLDYSRKVGGIGPILYPTGDIKGDMDKIRAFYAGVRGKFPEMEGSVRLRDEDEPDADSPISPQRSHAGHTELEGSWPMVKEIAPPLDRART